MRIGILYIGIGRYACFWQDFHASCERLLVPEAEKHYYVFTDSEDIKQEDRVSVYHQDDMGWPLNSLFRFKMFNRIKEDLAANDHLFFFNSNALIKKEIAAADILPATEDFSALCLASKSKGDELGGFESRRQSATFVPTEEAVNYYSGALNGGKCKPYLELIETCNAIADADLEQGIMPVWHDESVLNKFLLGKSVKEMHRDMGKPENWNKPRNAKIILRRKESVLGRSWLRNYKGREHTNTWLRKLLRKVGLVN